MATQAIVRFYDRNNKCIANIYHHFDGYPRGVGSDLYDFLKDIKIINGIQSHQNVMLEFASGIECLVAQYIAKLKDGVGGVYVVDEDWKTCGFYLYKVRNPIDSDFNVTVMSCYEYDELMFDGGLDDFKTFIDEYGEDD
jgi:hypothetical protein